MAEHRVYHLVFSSARDIKELSVASRYESVLVLRHPVEDDSGTYRIVASAGKVKSKEFSFKLQVKGNILTNLPMSLR